MNKKSGGLALVMLLIAALIVPPLLSGCGGDTDEDTREIGIGILLDFSGPAAGQGKRNIVMWEDMVRYTNEEDPIPGVTLKALSYDNQYDPGRVMIGYTSLRNDGAMVIVGHYPQDAEILKPRLSEDKVPMWIGGPTEEILDPPGWVFAMAPPPRDQMELVLQWISTERWDYQAMGRKPKIGVFGWDTAVSRERTKWAKEWVQAHPDDFEWVGEEIASWGNMNWLREAERLKDADYLVVGTVGPGSTTFINQAKSLGYEGEYIVNWPQVSMWDQTIESCGAETLNGTIFSSEVAFWYEDEPSSENIRAVCEKYHPKVLYDTLNVVINMLRMPIEAIRVAVEEVGVENVDGQAIYDVALNMKFGAEIVGQPGGYSTARPPHRQRASLPAGRIYEYRPDYEYGWFRLTDWMVTPPWEGIVI